MDLLKLHRHGRRSSTAFAVAFMFGACRSDAPQQASRDDSFVPFVPATLGDAGVRVGRPLIRVAQLMPNVPSSRLCVQAVAGDLVVDALVTPSSLYPGGVPFRGVSAVHQQIFPTGADYYFDFYSTSELDAWNLTAAGAERCPRTAEANTPRPFASGFALADELLDEARYTVAAVGFALSQEGTLPAQCGATLTDECPDSLAAQVLLLADPATGPSSSTFVKMRLVQAVPNLPPLDVCVDAGSGRVEIADSLSFVGSAAEWPVHLMLPALTSGEVSLHAHSNGLPECDARSLLAAPVAIPLPSPIGTAAIPGSVATFDGGTTLTVFASGNAAETGLATMPLTIPMLDLPPSE